MATETEFLPARFVWDVDDYRGVSWTVALVSLVLSISFLVGRLLYRKYGRALYEDDWPACGLLILAVICCSLQMRMASRGLGLTVEDVQPGSVSFISTGVYVNFILFVVAEGCSKLSLALTCKSTVFADRRKRSRLFWILPGSIAVIVLFGIIAIAAQFQPIELSSMGRDGFASLRTVFIVYLTLDVLVDLCTIALMSYKVSQLQMQSKSRNRLIFILLPRLLSIPAIVFFCRSITPERLSDDFTLHASLPVAMLALNLLISSLSTSVVAMGGSLESFDIREQTDFAMSTLNSRQSPGTTKRSHKTSILGTSDMHSMQNPESTKYSHTTFIRATSGTRRDHDEDASSDQMPILPDNRSKEDGIVVSKTVEHSTERA